MKADLTLDINDYLPLRDVVFNTLRQAILKGELEPGERLMEVQLANKLGVSRTPIREAIRKLELEGLVRMVPRKGAEVASITEKDMRDVLEVRTALDGLAVQLVCDKIKKSDIKELVDANKEFEKSISTKNLTLIAEADETFHDIIYKITENQRLIQMVNNLREQMYRYRLEYLKDENTHPKLVKEHEDIIEQLANKDLEAASKSVKMHVINQEKSIGQAINKNNK